MTELQSLKYFAEAVPDTDSGPECDYRLAELLLAEESDQGRGTVLTGMVLMMFGMLLANFGALQVLAAASPMELAGQPISRLVPLMASPACRWVLFGIMSLMMAGGMVMIGSHRLHSSLLVLHVLVPLSFIPLIAGWLVQTSTRRNPMSLQLWAGGATCLSTTSMVWLVQAVGSHQSHARVVFLAFVFQCGLALLVGTLVKFWRQVCGDAGTVAHG